MTVLCAIWSAEPKISRAGSGAVIDRGYVDEIIRSGRDVLPRLEKLLAERHLEDEALYSALNAIARIHFDQGHYEECAKTCHRFLRRYSPGISCGSLDKYLLLGDSYRKLGEEDRARAAYLRIFYHFNDYDYGYSNMHEKLAQRLDLRIRRTEWDGKQYDIPVFDSAGEQLAFALRGAAVVMKEPDWGPQNIDDPRPSLAGLPRPDTYNIGVVIAAYRTVLELFPDDELLAESVQRGLSEAMQRQRDLVARLDATIQDDRAKQNTRYCAVQWLGRIGGKSVVAPLRKARRLGAGAFGDHDIVAGVMRDLGIDDSVPGRGRNRDGGAQPRAPADGEDAAAQP